MDYEDYSPDRAFAAFKLIHRFIPDPPPPGLVLLLLPCLLKLPQILEDEQDLIIMIGKFLLDLHEFFYEILMSKKHFTHSGKYPDDLYIHRNSSVTAKDTG